MRWPHIKLGEMCEVITKGTTPTSVGFKFQESGINFVKVESIKPDGTFIPKKFAYIDCECHESFSRSQLQVNDILFSIAGALGRTAIVTEEILPANTNQALAVVRLKNDAPVCYEYLFRALNSSFAIEQIHKHSGGVAQQNLSLAQIKSFEIPVPPLAEQKQIVAILDEAFANIDHARQLAERNLKNANELFESTLHKFFSQSGKGWSTKTLTSVCVIKPPKSEARNKLDDNSQVSFVPMDCLGIGNKKLQLRQERKLREVAGSYTYFAENDVLLAKITPCFENGKLGIARNLKNKVGFGSSEFIVFRCGDEILPDFLYYYLDRQSFRDESKALMTGAVGHKRVAKDFIENYLISYPDIERQEEIVIILDELRNDVKKLEKIYQQKITALDELKQSLLRKAFRGELTQGQAAA